MVNKKEMKSMTSITAGITAVALLVSGTFAWNAFDQNKVNKIVIDGQSAAGRLHDDFNGQNKDVYVENYSNKSEGGAIYARIRLDEYIELGDGAGTSDSDKDIRIVRGDKPKGDGIIPTLDDEDTWDTYLYEGDSSTSDIRNYFNLGFGGSTIYMPTFNKNIDSLEVDTNGTLEGPDGDMSTSDDKYGDYQTYTEGQSITGNAIYDIDDNDIDEGDLSQPGTNHELVEETHVAKETFRSTVMSMKEWIEAGSQVGPYWVYDSDGWAYWAQAIRPETATGLLLTDVTKTKTPSDDLFYGINVVSQIATADDWGTEEDGDGFFKEGISDDALGLLNSAVKYYEITSVFDNIEVGSDELGSVDGINFSVINRGIDAESGRPFIAILANQAVGPKYQYHGTSDVNANSNWNTSDLNAYLNSDNFINTYLPSFKDKFKMMDIVSTTVPGGVVQYTPSKVWVLNARNYGFLANPPSLPAAPDQPYAIVNTNHISIGTPHYVRDARTNNTAYYVDSNGMLNACTTNTKLDVRPVFHVFI